MRFLSVRPVFCLRLPSHKTSRLCSCRLANISPCRACKGLSPSSECAMPGAQNKLHSQQATRYWLHVHLLVNRTPTRISRTGNEYVDGKVLLLSKLRSIKPGSEIKIANDHRVIRRNRRPTKKNYMRQPPIGGINLGGSFPPS